LDSHSRFHIVWCDSLGAKSFSFAIETHKGYILIDPGAAALQPSYPLDPDAKRKLRRRAVGEIEKYARRSKIVIITHYHYDHHILPSDKDLSHNIYMRKKLFVKNPNIYINKSQWKRARLFLSELLSIIGENLEKYQELPPDIELPDPIETLDHALSKDFGDYNTRRKELLEKGKEWFRRLKRLWLKNKWVREIHADQFEIHWAENRTIKYGGIVIKFLEPWYHGIEYDRTGWVVPLIIDTGNKRIFYTSDVMGPIIEDYAYYIADSKPDILLLDGPPTYLYPYMFNKINLNRAIENIIYIIDQRPELIIYDHHLLRDPNWKKYVEKVVEHANKKKVLLRTCRDIKTCSLANGVVLP